METFHRINKRGSRAFIFTLKFRSRQKKQRKSKWRIGCTFTNHLDLEDGGHAQHYINPTSLIIDYRKPKLILVHNRYLVSDTRHNYTNSMAKGTNEEGYTAIVGKQNNHVVYL